MSFSATVTRSPCELIPPCSPTPGGNLPLSVIDKQPLFNRTFPMMLVYKGGDDLGTAMRVGLSKALVPHYPVAGKISATGEGGDRCVECTGEGVLFVEARASCTLKDVDYLQHPHGIWTQELMPVEPLRDRIFMVQVTGFQCGGYAVCFIFPHVVFDGSGIAQFLNTVGEMARGYLRPTIDPVWDRDRIAGLRRYNTAALLKPLNMVQSVIYIPQDTVRKLMSQFRNATGRSCSVFEAVVAGVWQCRVRAIALDTTTLTALSFPMNLRPLMSHQGYYGNCIYEGRIVETSSTVCNAPHAHLVGLIQETKGRLREEYRNSLKGEGQVELPSPRIDSYAAMAVSDIRGTGIYDVDMGGGGPILCTPLLRVRLIPAIFITNPLEKSNGVRLVTTCVKGEHLKEFSHQINSLGNIPSFSSRL